MGIGRKFNEVTKKGKNIKDPLKGFKEELL